MGSNFNWFRYSSPSAFYPVAGALAPWFLAAAALLACAGAYIGFFVAPTDAQQGEAYRIIYIHVAAAWMSMFLYVVMACWAAFGLAFNTRLSSMMASAIAPTGVRILNYSAPVLHRAILRARAGVYGNDRKLNTPARQRVYCVHERRATCFLSTIGCRVCRVLNRRCACAEPRAR